MYIKKINSIIVYFALAVLIVVLAGTTYFFYYKWSHTQALIQNPTLATKEEIKNITDKLGKFINLCR